MLNRTATAVVRVQSAQSYSRKLFALAVQSGHGIVYGPSSHEPVAMNVGSRVRPEVVPVTVNVTTGAETVASFLARGGSIKRGPSVVARGFRSGDVVKVSPSRIVRSRG
jgi:hypothetical protein